MEQGQVDFETFIRTAWNDHGEQPAAVAERLAAWLERVAAPERVAPFVRLAAHVYGEHLGEWQRGVHVLGRVRALPACTVDSTGEVDRVIAMLRYAGGERSVLDNLARDDCLAVLATAAPALAGRGDLDSAIDTYDEALRRAGDGALVDGSPALRALAIGGNNLALALEERAVRSAREDAGMVRAACGGVTYWQRAGTWLEHERAEYRLARSLLAAGDALAAAESARRCLAICNRNVAPAFEQFFGWAALSVACRAAGQTDDAATAAQRAHDLLRDIPAEERAWCETELRALDG